MQKRQLGRSDLSVTPIALGAWAIGGWMWGGQDEDDAVAAIRASIDAGVTTIDTAAIYGYGHSEELVGRAIAGRRDQVQLLTKYVLRWDNDEGEFSFEWTDADGQTKQIYRNGRADSVIYECEQSLRRLGTDYIDLYQSHWRDKSTPLEETMGAIDKLLRQGKIRAAGVSNFTAEDIAAANDIVPIASDQPPYSMIYRNIEADVLPFCRENSIGVLVYSPLQRGLLTGKVTMERTFPAGDHRANNRMFAPGNRRKVLDLLAEIRPIADAHDATLAQLAVAWTLQRPGITAALVGARNPKQAAENAAAADIALRQEEINAIDAMLEVDFPVGWESAGK